jgi:3-oxoacyl-[acyl-carrier protein] reductase
MQINTGGKTTNRVAIVTGAGSGIGFRIAADLAGNGCSVVINDIDKPLVEKAADNITKTGGNAIAVAGDCSDTQLIDQLVAEACNHFGCVDMAVANAGITTFGSFLDYPVDDFQRLVDLNLRGTFYLVQRAARQMIQQDKNENADKNTETTTATHPTTTKGGSILLMSSVTGIQYHPDLTAYAMTKAAIQMLARSLGAELGKHGINVNAIAPGATLTERTMQEPGYEDVWANLNPTGRVSTTSDIANTALFLLSDAAAQITGQTIVVDGGWTTVSPPP